MSRLVKMFGGVFVLRRVTAPHVAARQAEPEMDPGIADLQAVFTAGGARRDITDLVKMSALVGHNIVLTRTSIGNRLQ